MDWHPTLGTRAPRTRLFGLALLLAASTALLYAPAAWADPISQATAEGSIRGILDACAGTPAERAEAEDMSHRYLTALSIVTNVPLSELEAAAATERADAKYRELNHDSCKMAMPRIRAVLVERDNEIAPMLARH